MSIDNYYKQTDNSNSNDDNEKYEVIKRDNLVPLIDPKCEHYFVKDDDIIDENTQSWICTKCKRGTFLSKDLTIINS